MRIMMLGCKEYPFGSAGEVDCKPGGGIERHVAKLAKHLAGNGHDVLIVTRHFPGLKSHERFARIETIRFRFINNRHLRTISYNIIGFLHTLKLARRRRIDIIHCHAVVSGFFGSLISLLTGIPMVFTPHGIDVDQRLASRKITRMTLIHVLRCARRVIFISRIAEQRLKRYNRNHALLSNAIDLVDYTVKPIRTKGLRFLYLGRLEKVKGIEDILKAFPIILEKYPDASLTFAGDGSLRKQIINHIESLDTNRIRYAGWLESSRALSGHDVFLLPSFETGQPIALLEAMAAGRIIITSLPFIDPGRNGLSCKVANPHGLSEVMLKVCREPKKHAKLARQAREDVKTMTWEREVILFEKEYKRALRK